MWKPFAISILLLSLAFASPAEIDIADPIPVCGTPHTWHKIPEIVTVQALAKPLAGDTTFYIREDLYASTVELLEVPFYKKWENQEIVIFVECAEFDEGRVTQTDVDRVAEALLFSTPENSVNPEKGILANEIEIFGNLPDVDHNGKLYVLLIDVRDGYTAGESETYVAGYFDPLDQMRPSEEGNYSDIIYIDTNPASVYADETLGIVAHELQHLIHFAADRDETTWLNEGMSELAPRILGLPSHAFVLYLHDTNRPLNQFDDSLTDYAKVGLWTFYNYRRFGSDFIKTVVQQSGNSLQSYEDALKAMGYSKITKEQLLIDWFIANLINDPALQEGKYSYFGAHIADLFSDHFSGNFTDNQEVQIELQPAAAEYIQFYAGMNLQFRLNYQSDAQFRLAVVKQGDQNRVQVHYSVPNPFELNDPDFGFTYNTITFIPIWTKQVTLNSALDIQYSASGQGGVIESIIHHDQEMAFYLKLDGATAAEGFDLSVANSELAGILFKVNRSAPITIFIYDDLNQSPLSEYSTVSEKAQWTRFNFEKTAALTESRYYLALASSDTALALGYSRTGQGKDRAFLNLGFGFYDLDNFSVGEEVLDGDWLIRAVTHENIYQPAAMAVTPDTIFIWNNENEAHFRISNLGTEVLLWSIEPNYPDWLTVDPLQGELHATSQEVTLIPDRGRISPGIFNTRIYVRTDTVSDSVWVSVLERNLAQPQAAIYPCKMVFDAQHLKRELVVFNIGTGEAQFSFSSGDQALVFKPSAGIVPHNDTVRVAAFLDYEYISDATIPFTFYNGVDSVWLNFRYQGTLAELNRKLTILPPIPNPFLTSENPAVDIRLRLVDNSKASLSIYNIIGQQVVRLPVTNPHEGLNLLQWDGRNDRGQRVSSAVYLLVLRQGNQIDRRKMMVIN